MCVHSFTELKDTFPMLFIISTYWRNLLTLQPHPKHHLNAEENVLLFQFLCLKWYKVLSYPICPMPCTCLCYESWQLLTRETRIRAAFKSITGNNLHFHPPTWSHLCGMHQSPFNTDVSSTLPWHLGQLLKAVSVTSTLPNNTIISSCHTVTRKGFDFEGSVLG